MQIFADGNTLRVVSEPEKEEPKTSAQQPVKRAAAMPQHANEKNTPQTASKAQPAKKGATGSKRTASKAQPKRPSASPVNNTKKQEAQPKLTPKQRAAAKRRAKLKLQKVVAIAASAVIIIGMSMLYLSSVVQNNDLVRNIGILEAQLDDLKAKNDAREFEINSSVDLNHVIQVATEELGMIRGTTEQIRTYDTSNSEYIQHLAEIPSN